VLKFGFQKQPMMRRVLMALLPILLFSIYLYGLKIVFLSLVIFPIGVGLEYLFEASRNKKISEAIWVTCALYLFSMPPDIPLWIAAIGIAFAVVVVKEVFGGFGHNPFNPAIAGRLFVYISFPNFMTSHWLTPGMFGIDAVSTATPLVALKQHANVDLLNLLFGFRAGALGESAVILIAIAAIYLIITKTVSWRIILSTLVSFLLLNLCLEFFKVPGAEATLPALLSGSFLFVTVFMATDPVSAPKKKPAQWIYGAIIGSCTVLLRTFSLFIEGTSFVILFANCFAMLFDEFFKKGKK